MHQSSIVDRRSTILSPWVTLCAKGVSRDGGRSVDWFHSLRQADYITVLAETPAGEVVLVRQFRPALERMTLELPGGLRDGDGDPAQEAARELAEETGFRPRSPLAHLGTLYPDTGRLENRLWCFHAADLEVVPSWRPEPGIERVLMAKSEFAAAIRSGAFDAALPIAIVGLALLAGKF